MPIAAYKTKKPQLLISLLPMSCVVAFQYDMLYGNMHLRIQKEAARLIKEEPERFFMAEGNGLVTQQQYLEMMGLQTDFKPKISAEDTWGHLGSQRFWSRAMNFDGHYDRRVALAEDLKK